MKRFGLLFLLLIPMTVARPQSTELTLEELIPGGKRADRFEPATLAQLQWVGDRYLVQQGDSLLLFPPALRGEPSPIAISRERINAALTAREQAPLKKLPEITAAARQNGEYLLAFSTEKAWVLYAAPAGTIRFLLPLTGKEQNFDYHFESGRLAFTEGNDLFATEADGSRIAVARSEEPGVSFGPAGVHRSEFGTTRGTFWSPDGSRLAFYRLDEREVGEYVLQHISAERAVPETIKYPMAGEKSQRVEIGVYRFDAGETTWLRTRREAAYLTNVVWNPAGDELYVAAVNRRQDTCRLEAYNAATGALRRTLFTETDAKYTEPEHAPLFLTKTPGRFVWQSRRNGFNHLYLYDTAGRLIRPLTEGEWEVTAVVGFDADEKKLIYCGTADTPLQQNLWETTLRTGRGRRLPLPGGVHQAWIDPAGTYLLDSYSNHETPREIVLFSLRNDRSRTLLKAPNPFGKRELPTVETGTLTAADDSTRLYYRLTLPTGFDPARNYPVVVYLYGGPHVQLVTDSWGWGLGGWEHYMARRGYVVFTVDGRGSARRGKAFESATYGRLGVEEARDQLAGIAFLRTLPYVDADRIGIMGWSFGGHLAARLALTAPEAVRMAVAGGPVTDWRLYEAMYTERYMQTPKRNPDGYRESDLNALAKTLRRPLLLIHGDEDPVVLWQHSLLFLKASVDGRSYPDYFVYPGHPHNMRGRDRVHLFEKITRYFDDHLNENKSKK